MVTLLQFFNSLSANIQISHQSIQHWCYKCKSGFVNLFFKIIGRIHLRQVKENMEVSIDGLWFLYDCEGVATGVCMYGYKFFNFPLLFTWYFQLHKQSRSPEKNWKCKIQWWHHKNGSRNEFSLASFQGQTARCQDNTKGKDSGNIDNLSFFRLYCCWSEIAWHSKLLMLENIPLEQSIGQSYLNTSIKSSFFILRSVTCY